MSGVGVRPTREGPGLSLPDGLGGAVGVVTGDNEDWEDGGGAPGSIPGPADTSDFMLKNEGTQETIKAHGSMGATETFDPTDGNVHTGTLNANCTFTLSPPVGTGFASLEFWLTEDGTGGWTVTWPVSVTEQGTHDTTLGTTQRVILESVDGGTSWIATWIGSSGGSALTVKEEGASLDTAVTSIDFVGAGLTATNVSHAITVTSLRDEPHVDYTGSVVLDGNGDPVMVLVA